MSTKQEVLWMIDNLCVTHTGFDTLALKKMVEKLDDRLLILEEDNNGVVTATIKAYPSPAKYVIQKGKVSYIQEYSGGTTKSERLISDLESFLREFENRIDDIYVGVREHRNLDVLREEFCHLQQDLR